MSSKSTTDDLDAVIAELRRKEEYLKRELDRTLEDLAACERAHQLVMDFEKREALPISPFQLIGCGTQREALQLIANLNGGDVRVRTAAHLIKEAGLSEGKDASIQATVHNILSSSEDWEWSEPGVFHYKGFLACPDQSLPEDEQMARVSAPLEETSSSPKRNGYGGEGNQSAYDDIDDLPF